MRDKLKFVLLCIRFKIYWYKLWKACTKSAPFYLQPCRKWVGVTMGWVMLCLLQLHALELGAMAEKVVRGREQSAIPYLPLVEFITILPHQKPILLYLRHVKSQILLLFLAACPPGRWGDDCGNDCPCLNGAHCDPLTGDCTCGPGWKGRKWQLQYTSDQ